MPLGADLQTRINVCEHAVQYGNRAAAIVYAFTTATIRRWRKELGYPPERRQAK